MPLNVPTLRASSREQNAPGNMTDVGMGNFNCPLERHEATKAHDNKQDSNYGREGRPHYHKMAQTRSKVNLASRRPGPKAQSRRRGFARKARPARAGLRRPIMPINPRAWTAATSSAPSYSTASRRTTSALYHFLALACLNSAQAMCPQKATWPC